MHIPVMLKEILEGFAPVLTDRGAEEKLRYFDGTFGRGGHLRAVLEKDARISALASDRDPEAIAYAEENFKNEIQNERLSLRHANFAEFDPEIWGKFDVMLLDLGVSSPQLDQGRRGFSFYSDGPLDMRMDPTKGSTAAEVIQNASEDELLEIFQELGEIQRPHRVVRAIIADRDEKPFVTTRDLAGLIERVDGWRKKGFHPATQYFMALRLYVNQELESVTNALRNLVLGLKPKGRLAVLTFHSLEDRIVKNAFKDFAELGKPVNKKVIIPEWNEAKSNPRARSAKLRLFERSEY